VSFHDLKFWARRRVIMNPTLLTVLLRRV